MQRNSLVMAKHNSLAIAKHNSLGIVAGEAIAGLPLYEAATGRKLMTAHRDELLAPPESSDEPTSNRQQ